ncbi:DciA family protein (plasmid) [Streptomyces sp. NBC_01362]|uniref:DciA family protein n=1 Tax=Streptomyces sp. NBC_01362 TaxID=2903839 RepID=UPI002E3001EB|nr:DciA family protein [Streptomyces sp. NBC_01362]
MTDTTSGVDLARVALRAARAAAKTQPQAKRRTGASAPRRSRGAGRDPLSFGQAISKMVAERGWDSTAAAASAASSILDQWPAIAPELVGKVDAVRFDAETRTLHLRPATPAYRTQLTLHQKQITAKVNGAVGPDTVRHLEILRPTALTTVRSSHEPAALSTSTTVPAPAAPEAPVKTRSDASAGYHQVLTAHRAAWTAERKTDPKVLAAARRQVRDQAREPVEQFGDGRQALADLEARTAAARSRSSDASRARALQRLTAERAGLSTITPAAAAHQVRRTA